MESIKLIKSFVNWQKGKKKVLKSGIVFVGPFLSTDSNNYRIFTLIAVYDSYAVVRPAANGDILINSRLKRSLTIAVSKGGTFK